MGIFLQTGIFLQNFCISAKAVFIPANNENVANKWKYSCKGLFLQNP